MSEAGDKPTSVVARANKIVAVVLVLSALGAGVYEFGAEVLPFCEPLSEAPSVKLARLERGQGPPLIFAHTGASLLTEGNTLAAVDRAVERGVDGIELDVVNTRTKLVLSRKLHTPGSNRYIPDLDAEALAELSGGHRYPALDEVLDAYANQLVMLLEIKDDFGRSLDSQEKLCRLIRKHEVGETVIVSSLNLGDIERFHQVCPEVAYMYELVEQSDELPAWYDSTLISVEVSQLSAAPAHLREGRALSVFTSNSVADIEQAFDAGALLVQTDRPGRAMWLRARRLELASPP